MPLMTGTLFTFCGSKNGGSSTPTTSTDIKHQVSGLNSATTYYRKVIADDGQGRTGDERDMEPHDAVRNFV